MKLDYDLRRTLSLMLEVGILKLLLWGEFNLTTPFSLILQPIAMFELVNSDEMEHDKLKFFYVMLSEIFLDS